MNAFSKTGAVLMVLLSGLSCALGPRPCAPQANREGEPIPDGWGTANDVDDSLARALGQAPERVLVYVRGHPKTSIDRICDGSGSGDHHSEVLSPIELLALIRRQRSVFAVSVSDVQKERSTCLARMAQRLNYQLRIYLASYGAADANSDEIKKLCNEERRELEPVVNAARKDPALRARRDGSLPDGPFRLDGIPRDVVEHCAVEGRISNPEGPWLPTDETTDPELPRSRLLGACEVAEDEWDINCEHGGYGPYIQHVRLQRQGGRWTVVQKERTGTFESVHIDPWPDCRSLARHPR